MYILYLERIISENTKQKHNNKIYKPFAFAYNMAKKLTSMLKRKLAPLALSALIFAMPIGKDFAKPKSAEAAASANITYTETYNGNYWNYALNYENTSNSQENLYSAYLYFPGLPALEWNSLGNGWSSIFEGAGPIETDFIDSYSTNPNYDINPGNALAGFNIKSGTQLSNISYDSFFTGAGGEQVFSGTATAAPIVPEPVSSLLFVTGAGVLAGRKYLKRKFGKSKRDVCKLK